MRVWDLPPDMLCNKHLIAQHCEIHSIFSILTNDLEGYSGHPEVKRWGGHANALIERHNQTVSEMVYRGMNHKTPLPVIYGTIGAPDQIQTKLDQLNRLKAKNCLCPIYYKVCACGNWYTKESWQLLPFLYTITDEYETVEYRNCVCKSTIGTVIIKHQQ